MLLLEPNVSVARVLKMSLRSRFLRFCEQILNFPVPHVEAYGLHDSLTSASVCAPMSRWHVARTFSKGSL